MADLCAEGWHVCASANEVAEASTTGQCPPASPQGTRVWLVRQAQAALQSNCNEPGPNNLLGCGDGLGAAADSTCAPLNRMVDWDSCDASAAWDCGTGAHLDEEANVVTKPSPDEGGVLCCRD